MSYQITKIPQPCGHAFQVSVPSIGGVGKIVAEIRFFDQDRDMGLKAIQAAKSMVEGMASVWRLTDEGPVAPNHEDKKAQLFTHEEVARFERGIRP
jgi:hypothetical protein